MKHAVATFHTADTIGKRIFILQNRSHISRSWDIFKDHRDFAFLVVTRPEGGLRYPEVSCALSLALF